MLLLHKPSGAVYATANPGPTTAAGEIGEVVLRHRATIEGKKLRLLDASPSGIGWLDGLMAALWKKSGPKQKPVSLSNWLSSRSSPLKTHRNALVERGLMEHRPQKFLGFIPDNRYVADPEVRDSVIAEIRQVARVEKPIDNRLALLSSLVHSSGLASVLGFDRAERKMLKSIAKGENLGGAVEAAVAATSAAIATSVIVSTSGGGGDGGGGGM